MPNGRGFDPTGKRRQRGSVTRRGKDWRARWRDENGKLCERSGFRTSADAWAFLDPKVDEVSALRRGDLIPTCDRPQTVDELLNVFLEKHGRTLDSLTVRKMTAQFRKVRKEFGDRHPDGLRRIELEDWRESLPPGSRHGVFRVFRQALTWGVDRGLVERNASDGIRNPRRNRHERREVFPFESWAEVDAVADELDSRYAAIPVFAVGTGLRPEEWIALHRSDIDREARSVSVRRRFVGGELKEGGKTPGSVRTVPLRKRVLAALDAMPPRIDTPILFPAPRGGYIDLEKFRHREWAPALRAAGIKHRRVYDMRHTFCTWALEDGEKVTRLARIMGTSLVQIEDTYFRWLERTDDELRARFDSYDAREAANA
jgi:integrase